MQLPITTCNEALTGAIFEGEHRYWPESSGDTLGRASVSRRESFPMRARTVVRPRSSVTAPTIQLLSPFPTEKKFHYYFFSPSFLYTPFFTVFHLTKLGSYKSQWRKWRTLTRPTQCRLYNSAKGSVMTLQSLWSRIDSNCKSLPCSSLFIVDFKNIFAAHMCCYYFPYWSGFDFVNTWLGRGMKFRRVISSKKTTTSAPNQDQRYKAAGSRQHEIMNCTDSACQA
jgi:hypothetical protein